MSDIHAQPAPYAAPAWIGPQGAIEHEADGFVFYPHAAASRPEGPYATLNAAIRHARRAHG